MALWLGFIAFMSGDLGSHDHVTHWVIERLARWFPNLVGTGAEQYRVSCALWDARKPAHLFEYAVLAVLLYRALTMLTRAATRRRLVVAAACCGIVGALDEIHQSFDPCRTPLATDALIDLGGGMLGLALLAAVRRWRSRRRERAARGPAPS